MLLNFSVSNFGSINEKINFSLFSGKISKQHSNHLIKNNFFKVLKGAAIYGANASGKTNFVRALEAFCSCVLSENTKFILAHQFKLSKNTEYTEFEVDFQINGISYRYSLKTNGIEIPFEQLSILQKNGNLKELFTRKFLKVEIKGMLEKSSDWFNNRTFQSSTTFLYKLAQDGIEDNRSKICGSNYIIDTLNFFEQLVIANPNSYINPVAFGLYFNQYDYQNYLKRLLKIADLGISDVMWVLLSKDETENYFKSALKSNRNYNEGTLFSKTSDGNIIAIVINQNEVKGFELRTIHNEVSFKINEESDGTKRLIDLSLSFFLLRNPNTCLFVDELDCRLHPFLSKFLIQEHMENENSLGQLIVTLHDLNLMANDIWRTDEIWFTEKRQDGSTDLYSLYQFTPRFDKDLQKGYIQGKYGAIPMIGAFENE
ncbi:MAG: ATP-binding protein [Alphaproteobacteria bacterium]|nr:ATP-binding protein [Alphaproteobacteria bacterium]